MAIDHAGLVPQTLAAQAALWTPLDALQFAVAALGLLCAFAALPSVFRHSVRALTQPAAVLPVAGAPPWPDVHNRRRVALALPLLVGLGLRLLAPGHLVMLFSGYELTERSAILTGVHRYGAGSQVLHRLLFALLPPDHATLVSLHRVVGALTLLPLLGWLASWSLPRAVVPAAWALATLPLWVHDAASESILVVGAFWLWAGLLLLAREGAGWRPVALLAAAAVTRPELLFVVPLLAWLQLRRNAEAPAGRLSSRATAGWLALWLLLALPQVLHVGLGLLAETQGETGRLARLFPLGPVAVLGRLLPFWPHAFPLAWSLLALRQWREPWRRSLLLATYVWAVLLVIDLPHTSVPRLQAPLACLWLLLGVDAWVRLPQRPRRLWMLLVVVSTLPGLTLFVTSNEDDGERFTRSALSQLPEHGACLVTLHESDPPDKGKVQRAFPDYLLRPPHRQVARLAMSDWLATPPAASACPGGTFLLIEHRCYAIHHHPRDAPALLPVCAAVRDRHPWRPLRTERGANHGQNEYGWYPDIADFALGLYQLASPTGL